MIAGFRANAKNPADFKLLHKAYPSDPYALMFRKDDPPFKALVDETLARLMLRASSRSSIRNGSRARSRRGASTSSCRCQMQSPDQGDCVLTSSGSPPLATRDLSPADRLHNAHHTPLTGPREFDIVRRSPRLRGKHVI